MTPASLLPAVLQAVLQAALVLALAPLLQGLVKKIKARLQNRQGPPLGQPYADLAKLWRKAPVFSEHASWVSRVAPPLGLVAVLAAATLIPTVFAGLPLAPAGDVLAVTMLFALARFFTALGGIDAGGAFGGMGSSREMALSALVEPAMLLSVFTVALATGSTDLNAMVAAGAAEDPAAFLSPAHLLALAGLFIAVVAETGRIPVDNPDTHLELTMIHEGMILETSGRYLALAHLTHMVKQVALFALLANVFVPWGIAAGFSAGALAAGVAAFLVKLGLLAFAVAATETVQTKMRLFRVPDLLGASFALSLLALVSGRVLR